jgi:hypothetical protein
MKNLTKFALIVATCATLGTTAALADSSQLQNQLAVDRQLAASSQPPMSVAVYAGQRGLGQTTVQSDRMETRHQLRYDAHGNTSGAYVPFAR